MIVAGIDIGTNTILMVVLKRHPDGSTSVLQDCHDIARLGEGLEVSGLINEQAIQRAEGILSRYRSICEQHNVDSQKAVATSALRNATNRDAVRSRLEDALGVTIDVISGELEAQLTFQGTVPTNSTRTLVIDIGGGSTELTVGESNTIHATYSAEIGAVKLYERIRLESKPEFDTVIESVTKLLSGCDIDMNGIESVIGVAGTPTSLSVLDLGLTHFNRDPVDGHLLIRDNVEKLSEFIFKCSDAELRSLPGIDPRRADILPAGSCILTAIMRMFSIQAVLVSTKGLRFGVAYKCM